MLVILLIWGLYVCVLLNLVPVAVLFVQTAFSFVPQARRSLHNKSNQNTNVVVLIPAHNESEVIVETLASIKAQLPDRARMLVVADNCTDDTVNLAKTAGAEVIERENKEQRGKGYALDFGIRHLRRCPPDVLIIIDADCQVAADSLDILMQRSVEAMRPVQALYLMQAPEGAGIKMRIAEFAWLVKNLVRPRGYSRMGLPCQLMGSGMAFRWEDIQQVNLAHGNIVEDLKLGLDLCRNGVSPLFCAEALVISQFPTTSEGQSTQRTRWEHGHLSMIFTTAPKLLVEAIKTRNGALLALLLDLIVPPVALLILASLIVFILSLITFLNYDTGLLLILATIEILMLSSSIFFAWVKYGRKILTFKDMAFAPVYVLSKLPLYLKFIFNRQVDWVRSKRDQE